ncbi:unnamed protein product, partial [Mesorhabditis spiculigera]
MITAPSTSLLRIGAAGQLLNVRGMGRRQPKQGKPPILPPSKKVLYHVVNPEWEKPEHVKELLWRRFAYNNGVNSLRILFKQEASSKISTGQGLASMREEEEKEFNILIAANEERNLKKSKDREIRSLEKWNTTRQEMMDEISSTLTEQEKQAKWANRASPGGDSGQQGLRAKLENPAPVKYQEGTPTIQKGRLRRMVKQINIKYRPLDYDDSSKYVFQYSGQQPMRTRRPRNESRLNELWKLPAEYTFDPPGDWTLIGFQRSNDPSTDFRSTGSLGLAQMLFFVKYHRIVLDHEVAWPEALPFALTSIHITAFLMALMKEQVLRDHFYAGNELPSLEGFNKIHCRLLWLMSALLGQTGRRINHAAFQNGVVRLLHFRQKSLHEITVEEIVSA